MKYVMEGGCTKENVMKLFDDGSRWSQHRAESFKKEVDEWFDEHDTNEDGTVTFEEYLEYYTKKYD